MKNRRVVVTGMGALTPIGLGIEAYWQGLTNGNSGAVPITHFDATKFKTRFACQLPSYKVEDYIDKKESRRMDPFCHYALAAADEALRDSGLSLASMDRTRAGVVVGSGIGGIYTFEEEIGSYYKGDGTPRFNPFFIPKMIGDIAAGHISMKHGLRGPNYATVSACATSGHSIMDSWMLLKLDLADVMVTGGAEAAITPGGIGGFNAMKALSERNDDPATASRPFDLGRDGFVLGEGSGVLVLEEYEHAMARGARIYAELSGCGASADAHHLTAPDPDGNGVTAVMGMALRTAGLKAENVQHINMHGTSTPLGDIAETNAIKKVFGQHAKNLYLNSTKSMTGHLLGAAGAIEAIATALALYHQTIPPTINHFTDDPECDLNYCFNQPVQASLDAAISNTFGFGGHNAALLFRRVEA